MKRAYPAAQRKPSVTWPPLSSGQHNVWLISVLQLHIWSLWKALSTRRPQQHISSQSKLHKRKEKESADAVELSSWISGKVFFFFFPLPFIILLTAFLIPIKPILHSCLSFIELAGDIFSTGWPWETVLSKFHKFQEWSIQIFLNMRDM